MNFISKLFKRKKNEPLEAAQEPQTATTTASEDSNSANAEIQSPASQPVENPDKLNEPQEITLKEAFLTKYPSYENILKMFEAANLCDATWENLTKVRLQKFVDYMNERLSPNSVNQYAAKLKAVLNLYSDEVLLPRGYAKVLTPRKVASTAVYLTEEELQKLIAYKPHNQREEYVRDVFVICCYGGMRHSDAVNLNESNISGGTLQYVSIKTKIHSVVPLKPIVREYILNRPQIEIDDTTYNRIIRNICKKCGITDKVKVFKAGKEQEGEKWQYVTSHAGRRTFASLLYLRGVDLYSISKMMGHSSVEMTSHYVVCGVRNLSQEAKEYFGGA